MNFKIRLTQPKDYCETEKVTREAFWNQYEPGCNEHYLLRVLRSSEKAIPELDFVATDGEKIIANAVCVKGIIKGDNGQDYKVATLGPIGVLPEYQGKGVGGQLIEKICLTAKEMKLNAIVLFGDPEYYSKHGFIPAENFKIRTADNMYATAHQIRELQDGILSEMRGRYIEDKIYEVDNDKATEFDQQFPEKEKKSGTSSQQRFEQLLKMIKKA